MRIAVFGTGAVGGYFGGRLAEAGEDVAFIARGEHLAAIRAGGLRVTSIAGDFVIQPAVATDDPSTLGPVDVVLLGVKAWQVADAAEGMRPLIGRDTIVVPLQNGVEARRPAGRGPRCGARARWALPHHRLPARAGTVSGTRAPSRTSPSGR